MTNDTKHRASEILADLQQIQYIPAELPREQRLGEIQIALESCIQAFAAAGASTEYLSQLQQLKGTCLV
jgi:hypothetical protein